MLQNLCFGWESLFLKYLKFLVQKEISESNLPYHDEYPWYDCTHSLQYVVVRNTQLVEEQNNQDRTSLSFSPATYKIHLKKLPKVFTTHLCYRLIYGSPILALVLNKSTVPAVTFLSGFNEKNFLFLNHLLELVTVISIQWQEGLTRTMKWCFNTCKFLETFTCLILYLESELMDWEGLLWKPTNPASQRKHYDCLFKDKERTRQY